MKDLFVTYKLRFILIFFSCLISTAMIGALLSQVDSSQDSLQAFVVKKAFIDNVVYMIFAFVLFGMLRKELNLHGKVSYMTFLSQFIMWLLWVMCVLAVLVFVAVLIVSPMVDNQNLNDFLVSFSQDAFSVWVTTIIIKLFSTLFVVWMALTLATQATSILFKKSKGFYLIQKNSMTFAEKAFGSFSSVSRLGWMQIGMVGLVFFVVKLASGASVHYGWSVWLNAIFDCVAMCLQLLMYGYLLRTVIHSRYLPLIGKHLDATSR